jgi:hypothetical protein
MKTNEIKMAQKRAQTWLKQHPPSEFEKQLVEHANTAP